MITELGSSLFIFIMAYGLFYICYVEAGKVINVKLYMLCIQVVSLRIV